MRVKSLGCDDVYSNSDRTIKRLMRHSTHTAGNTLTEACSKVRRADQGAHSGKSEFETEIEIEVEGCGPGARTTGAV